MNKPQWNSKLRANGFTLIELMIAAAVVAILAALALASYQRQTQQSRRTDARGALLSIAGREEKLKSVTNAYSNIPTNVGYTGPVGGPFVVGSGYYNVTIQVPDPTQAPVTPTTYLLTATAIGLQAGDTACATLSVNQLGQQTATGTGTAATCWSN